jgi:hypothetical protein
MNPPQGLLEMAQKKEISPQHNDDANKKSAAKYNNQKLELKKPRTNARLSNFLAPRPGLEPGTCGLTVRRSTD